MKELGSERESDVYYSGGNEVFFSFLQAIVRAIDRGEMPKDALEVAFEEWGRSLAERAELPKKDLHHALDYFQKLLLITGLARVFEPLSTGENSVKITVLRYLPAHYLRKFGGKLYPTLPFTLLCALVRGFLAQVGIPADVSFEQAGILRSDECVLTVQQREV